MMYSPLNVLLVEDSADDAEILLFELRQAAYAVTYARVQTANEMRTALARQPWDIILSDSSMPQFSGAEALEIVQSTGEDIPFIIVSGAIGEERAVEIMRAGAHDYIMKGNLKRLVPAIQRELREAEQRQARRHAEEQVIKLSRAMEQSASLVMITNIDGVIEYVNPAFARVTGYSSEELIGVHSRILQSGETPREVYNVFWSTILSGQTWRGELRNKKKSGEHYWVEAVVSGIKDPNGRITQFVAVQEDITERKRLEAELQRYTTQLERMVEERTNQLRHTAKQIEIILNNTSDGFALAQGNGDIRTKNPAFNALFGDRVTDWIEGILWTVGGEEEAEALARALVNASYDREIQRVEVRLSLGDGNVRDIDLAFIPVQLTEQAEQPGVLVSAHDVTYLREIARFKARFVANAVHDLATPISGLSTRVHLLKHRPDKLEEHVRVLDEQVSYLRNLLSDLRTLAEVDRSDLILNLESCNLNQLAMQVFNTFEPVARNNQQIFNLAIEPALPALVLDKGQIERVLVNLVSNALRYTPKGKHVQMKTWLESNQAVFSVSDEGIGISEEDLPRIFERFFRTDRARMSEFSGTGLGLAIVKEVIELHRGTVSAESKVDKGSTFTVRLPIQR